MIRLQREPLLLELIARVEVVLVEEGILEAGTALALVAALDEALAGHGHAQCANIVAAVCVLEGVGLVERHRALIDVHVVQLDVDSHHAAELESGAELVLAKERHGIRHDPVARQHVVLVALEARREPLAVSVQIETS